jgi:hypothetical protein
MNFSRVFGAAKNMPAEKEITGEKSLVSSG